MTRSALLVLAVVVLALGAGFGGAQLGAAEDPPPAARAGSSPVRPADPAPATGVDVDRGSVDAPPAVEPIAEVRGNFSHTRLGLLSLRRAGPKVLTASVRITAGERATGGELFEMYYDLGRVNTGDVSAMELRDVATGRANVPAVSDKGNCDCSSFEELAPGTSADVGATFRMPTAEGPFVLRVPGFPEIAGIRPAGD